MVNRLFSFLVAASDLCQCGTVVSANGDEEVLRVETMHLNQTIVIRCRAVHDQEREVIVLVDLRPLPELLRVLKRQRVKLESFP